MGIGIIIAALFLCALYLFLIWPERGRRDRMKPYLGRYIAHRGLHGTGADVPENSMTAFERAVLAGCGIELDVRETRDEELVVVHDADLSRVTGFHLKVEETTWNEIRNLFLLHSNEHVPRFQDVLTLVAGRVPLIVEIKCDTLRDADRISEHVAMVLDGYTGEVCVESFNPECLRWFRKNRPQVLRGQLSEWFQDISWPMKAGAVPLSCLLTNGFTRPDFIAYNFRHAFLVRFQLVRHLTHVTTLAWTVRSQEEWEQAAKDFDGFICEGFPPERPAQTKAAGGNGVRRESGHNMRKIIRKHVLLSGQVQGVGFRYRATWIAQDLDVTGWVRNCMDGRVEMEVQGTQDQIDMMLARLQTERYIEIDSVEARTIPVVEDEHGFHVWY